DHDAVAVALPGKPVAAFLSAISVCRALLTAETSEPTERARLGCDLVVPDREVEFVVPVERRGDELVPLGHADSSVPIYGERFSPRILADCARVLEMDGYLRVRESLDVGETVRFVPTEVVT
ncbi:MAG: molybdopterin molybdenumtransferase MoeA, partial [Haladaptatus sp.]